MMGVYLLIYNDYGSFNKIESVSLGADILCKEVTKF